MPWKHTKNDALDKMRIEYRKKEHESSKREGKDFAKIQQAKAENEKLVMDLEATRRNHTRAETQNITLKNQVSKLEGEMRTHSESHIQHLKVLDCVF